MTFDAGRSAREAVTGAVGEPIDRVDGRLKVTGHARYSAEFPETGITHAVIVQSTIANGQILSIATSAAESAPGVLAVLTYRNAPKLPAQQIEPPATRTLSLLQDNRVLYNGQPIAVVVADTFERATYAASLVRVRYADTAPVTDMHRARNTAYKPAQTHGQDPDSNKGDIDAGLAQSDAHVDNIYTTPIENHNPMEPHATIAVWNGDQLTLYDATQYVVGVRNTVSKKLGIPPESVRAISYYIGGGFGCKGSVWSHVPLAAMAARIVKRPVKLVLTRRQMFGPVGARPQTEQRVALAARRDGTLTAMRHDCVSHTSRFEDFVEPSALQTRMLYASSNIQTSHRLVKLDLGTPTFQRAPGEATGTFALESAMDELAVALSMDPVELRLKNYAESDPRTGLPWSSKSLRECYRVAGERFGWSKRNLKPGGLRDGDVLVGHGMATAVYPTNRSKASAVADLHLEGGDPHLVVRIATQDIGTGTYTVLRQVAADAIGLPVSQVRVDIGDSQFPPSPVSGGSQTAASAGSAVATVCQDAMRQLGERVVADQASPLHGAAAADVRGAEGRLSLASDPSRGESYSAVLSRMPNQTLTATADAAPGEERKQYSMYAFGAIFVEARVDATLGEIRIPRVVAAYGAGRILNEKTAHSQLQGGIVWGIGMALEEATLVDQRTARCLNADLAEYHVPVNADVGTIDVTFVDEQDPHVNPLGVKGIGEIGITGTSAAIANAVYNATGIRVRELPITLDKVLGSAQA